MVKNPQTLKTNTLLSLNCHLRESYNHELPNHFLKQVLKKKKKKAPSTSSLVITARAYKSLKNRKHSDIISSFLPKGIGVLREEPIWDRRGGEEKNFHSKHTYISSLFNSEIKTKLTLSCTSPSSSPPPFHRNLVQYK